jgi:hypothetical protein
MNVEEIGYDRIDGIHLAQDRVQRWTLVNMLHGVG